MLTSLKTAAASLVVGLTALTAVPAAAQDGITLSFGGGDTGVFAGDTTACSTARAVAGIPTAPGTGRATAPTAAGARRTARSTRPSGWAFGAPASPT